MLPVLFLLLALVPLAELWVILRSADAIGLGPTLLLLLAISGAGAWLLRQQGTATWARLRRALREGRVPAAEVVDGALILFGGALLLTPGFVTDIFGLAFLLPPTRALVRGLLVRRLARRMVVAMTGPRERSRRRSPGDVEGTAQEIDPERVSRPS